MVAIKNMEMPASCIDCPFQMIGDEQDFQCIVADKEFCNIDVNRRQDWCPLEELRGPFGSYAEVVKDAYYNNRHTNPEDSYREGLEK